MKSIQTKLALALVAALPSMALPSFAMAQDPAQPVEPAPAPGGDVVIVEHEQVAPPPGYEQQPPPPGYGQQQPVYGQPTYGQPTYGQPAYAPYAPQPRRIREPFDANATYPENARIYKRLRIGMLIPGAVVFVGSYALAATLALDEGLNIPNRLVVPVFGPWISMGAADTSAGRLGYAWAGITQAVGFALLIFGFIPRTYVEYYAGNDAGPRVTPLASRDGGGLQLDWRF
jgi:hypothetical protein